MHRCRLLMSDLYSRRHAYPKVCGRPRTCSPMTNSPLTLQKHRAALLSALRTGGSCVGGGQEWWFLGRKVFLAACLKLPFPATWGCCKAWPQSTCFSSLLCENSGRGEGGKKDGWAQVSAQLQLFPQESRVPVMSIPPEGAPYLLLFSFHYTWAMASGPSLWKSWWLSCFDCSPSEPVPAILRSSVAPFCKKMHPH